MEVGRMANRNPGQNQPLQNDQQGQNGQNRQGNRSISNQQNQDRQMGNPQTYYSYSYAYGYYDPYLDRWVINEYGPYTGKGPSGYERSDDRISEDVCDILWLNGDIDASDVDVDVKNGVVTFKGTVENRRMKRLAEDLAYSVPGVDDVQNQLRIQQHQGQLGTGGQGLANQTSSQGQNFKSQLSQGMQVNDSNGKKIGTVKEIHGNDILIDRPLATDVHVPFSAIGNVAGNIVQLNVPADQVDNMHWATSPKQTAQAR